MLDNGHWQFGGVAMKPHENAGFVYCIRHRATGVMYFGRKNFIRQGRYAGFESDWRSYQSSSKKLQNWIAELGTDAFYFIVLEQYRTMGGLGYAETWTLMTAKTTENPQRFLNKSVESISWHSREKITERHESRLKQILSVK